MRAGKRAARAAVARLLCELPFRARTHAGRGDDRGGEGPPSSHRFPLLRLEHPETSAALCLDANQETTGLSVNVLNGG